MSAIAVPPTAAATHDRRGRGVPWSQWLRELTEYLHAYGEYPPCRTALGSWVSRQRTAYTRGALHGVQVSQLEALPGWLWSARKDPWPTNFERLRTHLAQHGKMPRTGAVGDWVAEGAGRPPAQGTSLYFWVGRQRRLYAAGKLTAAQITQLEGLSGWTWNRQEESWREQYGEVANTLSAGGAYPRWGSTLGAWIATQRRSYRQGSLSTERLSLLESLPGWRWRRPSWNEQYDELSRYVAENRRLPRSSTKMGCWIRTQHTAYRQGRLSADQTRRLENLTGWSWPAALNARSAAA